MGRYHFNWQNWGFKFIALSFTRWSTLFQGQNLTSLRGIKLKIQNIFSTELPDVDDINGTNVWHKVNLSVGIIPVKQMDASVTSLAYRVLFLVLSARVASESIYCDGLLGQNDVDPVLGWDYTNRCRLHAYQLDDVVECFNVMGHYIQHPLHLAFVGDSRTRQQFISFLKVSIIMCATTKSTNMSKFKRWYFWNFWHCGKAWEDWGRVEQRPKFSYFF